MKLLKNLLIGLFVFFVFTISNVYSQPWLQQEFPQGLVIQPSVINSWFVDENKLVTFYVYDSITGKLISPAQLNCTYMIYDNTQLRLRQTLDIEECFNYVNQQKILINHTIFDGIEDTYGYSLHCHTDDKGGSVSGYYDLYDNTKVQGIGIWTCPTHYNLLWIILVIIIATFILAIAIQQELFGVLAGIMTIGLYFYIGACSPIMMAPIGVIGLLITLYFAIK